jgi:hypothetical protein
MNVIQATEFLGGMHVGQEQVGIIIYKSKGTVCRFFRNCRTVLDAMLSIRIGSGFNGVPGSVSGSGSRRAKITHRHENS